MEHSRSDKGKRRSPWITVPCAGCGKLVERRASEARTTVYCCRTCFTQRGIKRHTSFYQWVEQNLPELITEYDLVAAK